MSSTAIRHRVALLVAASVMAVAGCSSTGNDVATAPTTSGPVADEPPGTRPPPASFEGADAAALLRRAAADTAEIETFKAAVSTTHGNEGDPASLDSTATGEFDRKAGRAHTSTAADTSWEGGQQRVEELVVDGTTAYLKTPLLGALDKPWAKMTLDQHLADLPITAGAEQDPAGMLELFEGASDEVEALGPERVRGVETTHVRTQLDLEEAGAGGTGIEAHLAERLGELTNEETLPTIPAEAWVDGDGHIRRFTFSYVPTYPEAPPSAPAGPTTTVTIELYDFDEPVDIEIPSGADVADLTDGGG